MKGTLEILIGPSASGKSTYAHEKWKDNPEKVVIVSRDNIRKLIFGFNDLNTKDYVKNNREEALVTKYERLLIKEGLNDGKHVILDNTHTKKEFIERHRFFNVKTIFTIFGAIEPKELLIKRDSERLDSVGPDKIQRQIDSIKHLTKNVLTNEFIDSFSPTTIKNDPSKPGCYIFDIDGTLALRGDRGPYDWKRVGEDTTNVSVVELFNDLEGVENIFICSGRDEICRAETNDWLYRNQIQPDWFSEEEYGLFMRKEKDQRPDWVVKREFWEEISKEYYIIGIIDDRDSVVTYARSLGLPVFQVAYNNF